MRRPEPRARKTYRNPVIYAMELRDRMAVEGINRAELARRLGVSRGRVTQWLDLLELPEQVIRDALAAGDNWTHQIVTERRMRLKRTAFSDGRQLIDPSG